MARVVADPRSNLPEGYRGTSPTKKRLSPCDPPRTPRHRPTVKSQGEAFSYKRGTPVRASEGSSEAAELCLWCVIFWSYWGC